MKSFRRHSIVTSLAAMAIFGGAAAVAQTSKVSGEKLDSGLGSLPHYSQWKDRTGKSVVATTQVEGQKLDSGLGDLPHYSKWADPTGKTVTAERAGAVVVAARR
jgi:hypothetical protein